MNKLLIPLVILLSSLLFSLLWWNPERRPHCNIVSYTIEEVSEVVNSDTLLPDSNQILEEPIVNEVDTTKFTEVEKALFKPLDVYFKSGSSELIRTQEINDWLTLAKKYLAENPNERLSVTGHSDSDGSEELNLELSKGRAQKLITILTKEGFESADLVLVAKGETEPIADNSTQEGKAKNRRVSIRLIK